MKAALREACAVSPYPSAEPPQTPTQALGSITPSGAPCPSWSPGGWRKTILVLSPSQTTWAPAGVPGAWGLQGLEGNDFMGAQRQAGGAMEDVFLKDPGRQAHGEGGWAS